MKNITKYTSTFLLLVTFCKGFAQTLLFEDNFTFNEGWTLPQTNPDPYGNFTLWRINADCAIDDESLNIGNYYSGTDLWNCGYAWNGNNNQNGIVAYKTIIANGFDDLKMIFDWKCYGEWYSGWGNYTLYDYGEIGYSLDNGATFTWLSTGGNNLDGKYYNQPNTKRNDTLVLPDILSSQTFILAFKWIHDNSIGADPGFTIDNVRIFGNSNFQTTKEKIFEEQFKSTADASGWNLQYSHLQGSSNTKNGWNISDGCVLDGQALSVNILEEHGHSLSCEYIDNHDIRPNGIVASTTIDAYGYQDLELTFDWICKGENWGTTVYDYGQVGYSLDGGFSYTWIQTGGTNNSGKYYNQTTPKVEEKIILPANLKNKEFQLAFKWISDYSIGYYPGFVVDNIIIEGSPAPTPIKMVYFDKLESSTNWELETGPKSANGIYYCAWKINSGCGIDGPSLNIMEQVYERPYYECSYPAHVPSEIFAKRTVDARGLERLSLKFDWKCDGERWSSTYYDYGQVGYSLDEGTTFTWLDYGGHNNTGFYTDQITILRDYNLKLPAELNNQKFILAFKWRNDYSVNGESGFMVDNLKIFASGKGIRDKAVVEIPKINRLKVEKVTLNGVVSEQQLDSYANYEDIKITENNYIDGLGRTMQKVIERGSPNHLDLISPTVYTPAGIVEKTYLPYESLTNNGEVALNFVEDQWGFYHAPTGGIPQSDFPFGEVRHERSSNKHLKKVGAPGKFWQMDELGNLIKHYSDFNKSYENLYRFEYDETTGTVQTLGTYSPNQVSRQKTVDENKSHHLVFTNSLGQKILDLRIDSVTNEFFRTYYIYDPLERLRVVLTPKASEYYEAEGEALDADMLDSLAFQYNYDSRNRLIEKKIPGSGWVYHAYDQWDRLVATQDANQRAKTIPEFTFNKYDALNRIIITGVYSSNAGYTIESIRNDLLTGTFGHHEETVNNNYTTWLSWPVIQNGVVAPINAYYYFDHYDYYDFGSINFIPEYIYSSEDKTNYTNGRPTGKKVRILGTTNFLVTVNFYDDKGRVIQTREENISGGMNRSTTLYNFSGNVTGILENYDFIHENSNVISSNTIKTEYSYDHMLRLLEVSHKINNEPSITILGNEYNKLGQLMEQGLHSEDFGTNYLQKVNYLYNIRGWLTNINDVSNISSSLDNDLFAMGFNYTPEYVSQGRDEWGGNIRKMDWVVANEVTGEIELQQYRFAYDYLGRLKGAGYSNYHPASIDKDYNVNYSYDLNGNFKTLLRKTNSVIGHRVTDDFEYSYQGNQLVVMNDDVTNTLGIGDFKDLHDGNLNNPDYLYDANGNMTKDLNTGINSIDYNFLNLPSKIAYNSSDYLTYVYSAEGVKLQKIVTFDGSPIKRTYLGSLEFVGNDLDFIAHEAGRALPITGGSFNYQYNLKDHLGNVRVVFDKGANGEAQLVQENHYYPFGGLFNGASTYVLGQDNDYLYNGKELQKEFNLNWYDYGARFYDPAIGRWHVQDPLAEAYYSYTPYNYVMNNPMNMFDPDGRVAMSLHTEVMKNDDGTFNVTGGAADGDKNIYVVDNEGGRTGEVIGESLTEHSFLDDNGNAVVGAVIDPNDQSGSNFLNDIVIEAMHLLEYMPNATGGEKYDFKTNNIGSRSEGMSRTQFMYRGMPFGKVKNFDAQNGKKVFGSARDFGNVAAGFVAGYNGLSWGESRLGFDGLESYQRKWFATEGNPTQSAERLGFNVGNRLYSNKRIQNIIDNPFMMGPK